MSILSLRQDELNWKIWIQIQSNYWFVIIETNLGNFYLITNIIDVNYFKNSSKNSVYRVFLANVTPTNEVFILTRGYAT